MKNAWYKIPSSLRRGVVYILMAIGISMIIFWTLNGVCEFLDIASKGWVEQADSKAQWAVQKSGVKIVEVQE